jgi:predicted transcriptional regulator of viral defense system
VLAPPDVRIAMDAARQHGVVSARQLEAAGLNRTAIAVRGQSGRLHRIHRGVYAVGHDGLTLDGRFMAAVLAGGAGAVLSHRAGCALAGLVRWDDNRRIDVTVLDRGARARPGIRFHRARSLDPRDTTRIRGIPTTTPARAILEIAPQLSDERLKRLVRQAQAEQLANVRQFAETIRRANGHRATRRLAALIATGPAATRSTHEDIVLDLILQAGFEHPDVNERLHICPTPYRPDMRWPAQRLILDVDSPWHDGRLAQELDATRQAELEAAGERILRTTLEQATRKPAPARRPPPRRRRALH